MTLSCPETRARFAAYLDEELQREERSALRAHLAACASCRSEAGAEDPALLFASVAPEPVSAEDTARVLASVRAGIALKSVERRVRVIAPVRRFAGMAAAVAAAALLALTVGSPAPPRAATALLAAHAAPPESSKADAAGAAAGANATGPARPSTAPFAEAAGPAKGRLPADATIYDWNPGGGQPRVVWIVDRSLDI